jgi:formate-dependent nitrite reductase membrane component NrfD
LSTAQLPPQPDEADRGAARGGDDLPAHATYYERPLLKKPHWESEVVLYLFLGGIMGGSGMLAMLADGRREREADLARSARYVALALAMACPLVLITHLGRPERFLNMLRIAKFKSVMSMGVWGLVVFGGVSTATVTGQLARDGVLPRGLAVLASGPINVLQGLIGGFIAGYTGVLLSATAIPVWAIGKRHIPAFSVCSGFAGACALNAAVVALTGSDRTRHRLERLERIASTAELILLESFRRHAGSLGDPMFGGARGAKLRTYTQLAGIIAPALLGLVPFGGRTKTLLTSALTLAGGYVLRETLIEGGKASADDPRAASRQPE